MPAFCVRLRLVSGSLKDASAAILKMAAGDTAEKVRPIFFTLEKKRDLRSYGRSQQTDGRTELDKDKRQQ
jgi:hypothetical protein